MTDQTALYRHFDRNGDLLYVGISLDAVQRLSQHSATQPWAGDIASVTIEQFMTRQEALTAERRAIETEKPKHNGSYGENLRIMDNLEFKAIRGQLGLTQAQLATVLGYDLALTVSTYERKTNPRPIPHAIALLMRAYGSGYRPENWPT